MCEPYHSTIQWDVSDGIQSMIQAAVEQGSRNALKLVSITDMIEPGVKVGAYLHYSAAGAGHSLAAKLSTLKSNFLQVRNDFETEWWNRSVKIDTFRHGDETAALDAATIFANRKCIGDLNKFRSFLTRSLTQTENPATYVNAFVRMLNGDGQVELERRAKYIIGKKAGWFDGHNLTQVMSPVSLANFLCGFTKKRSLLVPEWADDDAIWS